MVRMGYALHRNISTEHYRYRLQSQAYKDAANRGTTLLVSPENLLVFPGKR